MKKKYWLLIAAILMMLVGASRFTGGMALMAEGRSLDTAEPIIASRVDMGLVAMGLYAIGLLLVAAAAILLAKRTKLSWRICWATLILFLLGGFLNGTILFGHPLDPGQVSNVIAVIVIGAFLFLGRQGLKTGDNNKAVESEPQ